MAVPSEVTPLNGSRPVPLYLGSSLQRWVALFAVTFCVSFSAIVVVSWQTLQSAMVADGIFQCHGETVFLSVQALDQLSSVIQGLNLGFSVISGLAFDTFGPRTLGVVSSLVSCIGLLLMALSLTYPCAFSNGVYFAIAVAIGNAGQVVCGLAYLWLLPDHAFVVSAMNTLPFVIATIYGAAGGHLHLHHGLSGHDIFYIAAAGSLVSMGLSYMLLPSHPELVAIQSASISPSESGSEALEALSGRKDESGAHRVQGGRLPEHKARSVVPASSARGIELLRDTYTLLFHSRITTFGTLLLLQHLTSIYSAPRPKHSRNTPANHPSCP